jgi:MYXO-CTERM domain-containing protein
MNHPRRALTVAALALCSLVPTVASASYPAGVWALVEKVTPEPDDKNPNRVRIDGVFMVAHQQPDFAGYPGYSVPAYGHMYYQCSDKDLATCQMEWTELAKVAVSDDQCRGWGDSSLPDNGTVRTSEPQANPDTYPLSMGILPGFTPCDALKAWKAENPPQGATTGEDTGEGTEGEDSEGEGSSGEFASESSGGEPATTSGAGTSGDSSGPDATTQAPTSDGPNTSATGESGTSDSTSASGGADTGSIDGDKGCVCSSGAGSQAPAGLAALLGLLGLRRRRRAA